MKTKKDGFYMLVSLDDRKVIDLLKNKHAVNISQAFRVFLKQMLERLEGEDDNR